MQRQAFLCTAVLLLLFSWSGATAQSNNRYAVLQNNYQNINPAATNHYFLNYMLSRPTAFISVQGRTQSTDNNTQLTSQSLRFEYVNSDAKVFFGGSINRESINIQETVRLSGNLAYQIDLDKRGSSTLNQKTLSFGLGAASNFQSADLQLLPSLGPANVLLPVAKSQYYTFSAGAFFLLKKKFRPDFYAGLSAHHNMETAATPSSTQLFLVGGMVFPVFYRSVLLEPVTIVSHAAYDGFLFPEVGKQPLTADAGLRIWFFLLPSLNLMGGVHHGTDRGTKLELGLSLSSARRGRKVPTRARYHRRLNYNSTIRIGYSYDSGKTDAVYGTPLHELLVTFPLALSRR